MQHGGVKSPRILVAGGPDLESCPHYWLLYLKLLQAYDDDLCSLCITRKKERMCMCVLCVCVCIHDHVCVYVSWLNACRRELILFLQGTITIENTLQESIIGKWLMTPFPGVVPRCLVLLKTDILKHSMLLISHFSHVQLCVTPSLGFSGQEHWSGLPFPSPIHKSEKWKWSRSAISNSSRPHGLQPTRLLRPWDFPGKSTGVRCHCLLCKHSIDGFKHWMF